MCWSLLLSTTFNDCILIIESIADIEATECLPSSSKSKTVAQSSSVNAFTLISSVMKTGESPKFLSDRLGQLYVAIYIYKYVWHVTIYRYCKLTNKESKTRTVPNIDEYVLIIIL